MEGLQKRLDATWSIAWRERLSQVVIATDEMLNRAEPVLTLADEADPGDPVWLLAPLLETNEVTVIFADGGIGKSLFCLAAAISIASGSPVLPGMTPAAACPVLYLDWETNAKQQRRRMGMIAAGMSIPAPGSLLYRRMSGPLIDSVEYLRQIIVEKHVGLVIVDSAGYATNGDINEAESALGLANAIRALGTTVLVIAHVPKERENRDRPIGSVYFHNAARSTWTLVKEQQSGEASVHLGLIHKKSNNGPLHSTIAFRVDFQHDAVRYYRADPQATAVIAANTSDGEQIAAVLRRGALTVKGILSELGWPESKAGNIRKALSRDSRFVRLGAVGKEAEWGLQTMRDNNVSDVARHVAGGSATRGSLTGEHPMSRELIPRSTDNEIKGDAHEKEEPW